MEHKNMSLYKNLLLLLLLVSISFGLFYKILFFGLWGDDWHLFLVSKLHPGHYGVYWGHPATVFEFFLVYKLIGVHALAINMIGIFLRALAAFSGYLFIGKLTKSRSFGIIYAILFVTSYASYEATTWGSAHIVLIDLTLLTLAGFFYLQYYFENTRKHFLLFSLFLLLSLIADTGRTFPFAAFLVCLFFVHKQNKNKNNSLTNLISSKEIKKIFLPLFATIAIFLTWFVLFNFYFSGGFGRHHNRIPFETIRYFFGSISNLVLDVWIHTPEYSLGFMQFDRIYILASIIIPFAFLYGIYKYIKTHSFVWALYCLFFFWSFLFYVPSWISYPRSFVSGVHRYLTISSFGFFGLLALGIFELYKKHKKIACVVFGIVLACNIFTLNFYLHADEPRRTVSIEAIAWKNIYKQIPYEEKKSLVYIHGENPMDAKKVIWMLGYTTALYRGVDNEDSFIRSTNSLEKIGNELCKQGVTTSEILYDNQSNIALHAFVVDTHGAVKNITHQAILSVGELLRKENSCGLLRKKYGVVFNPTD